MCGLPKAGSEHSQDVLSYIGLTICAISVLDINAGFLAIRLCINPVGSTVVRPLVLAPECQSAEEAFIDFVELLVVIKSVDAILTLPDVLHAASVDNNIQPALGAIKSIINQQVHALGRPTETCIGIDT